jgi:hypothetical protein
MSYLYVKWNSFGRGLLGQRFRPLKHLVRLSDHSLHFGLSAPPTASQAAFREWSVRGISQVLFGRAAFGPLVAALFALLPSCP